MSIQLTVKNPHRTIYLDITPERIIVSRSSIEGFVPLQSVVIVKETEMCDWLTAIEIILQLTVELGNIIFPIITEWQREI